MAGNTIGAKIVLEGEANYRKALKNINTEQKELRSEMKLANSQFKDQQNSIDALSKKNEILHKQYEKQKEKVEIYSKAVLDAAKRQEEAGSKVAGLRDELEKANGKMDDMADTSDTSADAIEGQKKAIEELQEKLLLAEDGYLKAQNATHNWKTSLNEAQTVLNNIDDELKDNQQYLEEAKNSAEGCADSIDEYGKRTEDAGKKSDTLGKKGADAVNELAGAIAATGIVEAVEDITEALEDCADEFATFETASAKIKTIADESAKSMSEINTEIIAMSSDLITPAEQLADAVYNSLSAGVDTANVVEFAGRATKLATGGFTDATTAVDILTTTINAYGLEVKDATKISDYLVTTQNLGKTTVAELATNMGKVIPVASAYNVEMDNLSTVYAVLTANGIATAESTTYIKSMINELGDSGSTVSKTLNEMSGKSFASLMKEGKSLGDVIAILGEAVGNDAGAFNELWSSSEAGIGALSLLSSGAEGFNDVLDQMRESAGATDEAFETMVDTSKKTEERMDTAMQNLKIAIGEVLAPELDEMREKGADAFEWATEFVKEHPEVVEAIKIVVSTMGMIAGGVAVVAGAMATFNAVMAITNPIGIAVGAIGGLTGAMMLLAGKTDEAKQKQKDLIETVEKTAQKLSDSAEQRKNSQESEKAQIEIIGKLKNELIELNSQETLSVDEKSRMKLIVDELNEAMPELNLAIDEQTGYLAMTNDEAERYIDNMQRTLEIGFMEEDLTEIARERYEAEKNLAEIESERITVQEEINRLTEEYEKACEEGQQMSRGRKLAEDIREQKDALEELNSSYELSKSTSEDLQKEYTEMSQKLDDATKKMSDTSQVMEGVGEVTVTYKDTVHTVTEQVKQDIQVIKDAYQEAYEKAYESISGQVGLFEELNVASDLSTQEMSNNLKTQTDTFTTYKDDLLTATQLVEAGLMDEGLLGSIKELGVDGAGYLHELVTAAETDTESFNELMKEWAAMETAKTELAETMADIETDYTDKMDELLGIQTEKNDLVSEEMTTTSDEIQENVEDALDQLVSTTSDSLDDMKDAVKEKTPEVKTASQELCSGAVDGANDILAISEEGKSITFVSIGYSIPQGIAQGISDGQQLITDALQDAIDNAIESIDLSGITAKINRELGDLY